MKNFLIAFSMASAVTLCVAMAPAAAQLYGGPSSGEAVIYADPNFRGDAIIIRGAEPNLREIGLNDKVSSIEVSGRWEVCVDPNFRNRCTIVDGPIGHLSSIRMNDNITSLRPLGRGSSRQVHYDRNRGGHDAGRGGRGDRGSGNYHSYNDGVKGRTSVFFPRPRDGYGDRIKTRRGSAARFCQHMGYGQVLYANTSRRSLSDVLCAR